VAASNLLLGFVVAAAGYCAVPLAWALVVAVRAPVAQRNHARTDRAEAERDQLLRAIEEHRAEKSHGPTANMEFADQRLYAVLDRVGGKGA
jgi:hypothetical protein